MYHRHELLPIPSKSKLHLEVSYGLASFIAPFAEEEKWAYEPFADPLLQTVVCPSLSFECHVEILEIQKVGGEDLPKVDVLFSAPGRRAVICGLAEGSCAISSVSACRHISRRRLRVARR